MATRLGMVLAVLCGIVFAVPAQAVSIIVKTNDAPQQGFNDLTPRSPVGGNPGTTLGAQRKFILQYAASAWGLRLGGSIPVVVSATFQSLGGTSNSAVLGSARPTTLERDFTGAPRSLTWYAAGLAHQLAGADRNDLLPGLCPDPLVDAKCPELFTRYNSDVDGPDVLGSVGFYYGIDGNEGSNLDFLSVVLHELGHGLGLLSLIDPVTGRISPSADPSTDSCQSCSDAYSNNLEDPKFNPKAVSSMTNNQRIQAVVDDGQLVWTGASVVAVSHLLNAGARADGAVQIFAPKPYRTGSSVSHLDTDVAPNELMEPYATSPPPLDMTVSVAMMKDLGWSTTGLAKCGDPNNDKKTNSTDALLTLKGAVQTAVCPKYLCDVNLSTTVTTTDALILLKRSVGQNILLTCPLA